MFNKFLNNFNKLPGSNRSMVFLLWIYYIGNVISSLFVNIYIYKLNNSFNELIFYNIIYYTFTLLGFSVIGYLMSVFQKNIKNLYYYSYFFFILSFIVLLFFGKFLLGALLFGVFYGFGHGLYWNGIHSQELANVKDSKRDLYSSAVSIGKTITEIGVPFIVSLIFLFGEKIDFDGYLALFFILPFVYFLSFFFINRIEDYIPKKVEYKDIKRFMSFKNHKYGNMFFFFGGIQSAILSIVTGILSLYMLKNEINIGIFKGILAIFSTLLVIYFSLKRTKENRFKYLIIFGVLYFINYTFLALYFDIFWFIVFSLVNLFIIPLFRISNHVYTLSLIDNMKIKKGDFFTGMIVREIFLCGGRIIVLVLLYLLLNNFTFETDVILRTGLLIIGLTYLIIVLNIYLWEKHEEIK